MAEMYITLAELKDARPCKSGYMKLMRGIEWDKSYAPEDVRIPIRLIEEVNGVADAWWAARYLHLCIKPGERSYLGTRYSVAMMYQGDFDRLDKTTRNRYEDSLHQYLRENKRKGW